VLWPWGTFRLYWNSDRNQSCKAFIWSYVVVAPAVMSTAMALTDPGKSAGSSVYTGSGGLSDDALRSTSALKVGTADTMVNSSPVSRSPPARTSADVSAFHC